ncbi:MAG: TIGR04211 family SH3 domain-containing protein, partial [Pseudomonadota bacterium]|nr:TIGR04211 family SH3 domain-containing protein [Pseudomonadota bacterium]
DSIPGPSFVVILLQKLSFVLRRMLSVVVPALLLAGALAAPGASAEERYVADHVDITLRSGPGKEFRIRRMVKGGTKVEVLERNTRGYSLVMSPEGTKGWVLSRYLVRGPVEPRQVAEGEVQEAGVNESEADKNEAVEAETDAVAEQLETQTVEETAPIADAPKEMAAPQEAISLQVAETPSTEEPSQEPALQGPALQEPAVQEPALQEVAETGVAGTASEVTTSPEPVPAPFEGQSSELPATPFAQQLEDQLNNVLKEIGQIQDRLGDARPESPDVAPDVALVRDEITALKQELEYSRKQQMTSAGNETHKPDERERWLLIGAGVFVAGTLMGMLISRVSWRRRRSASGGLRLNF